MDINKHTCLQVLTKAKTTRSKAELFLRGEPVSVLTGSKLPQLHNYASWGLSLSPTKTIFCRYYNKNSKWVLKYRIPIKQSPICQTKLEKVFKEWNILKTTKVKPIHQLNLQNSQTLFPSLITFYIFFIPILLSVCLYYKKIKISACSVKCSEYIKS